MNCILYNKKYNFYSIANVQKKTHKPNIIQFMRYILFIKTTYLITATTPSNLA